LGGISIGRNLSQNVGLLAISIGVVGTLQMVFTNLIMTIHMNKTVDQPSMSSMVVGGYKNTIANI
jgi:hypothetical protein